MQNFRGVSSATSQDEETGIPFMARSRGVRARKARAFNTGLARCRYGSKCWRPGCMFNHGDCPERTSLVSALADFWRSQSVRESTDYENQVQRDISQLRGAVCKLAAKIMWNSAISDTSNRIQEQIVESIKEVPQERVQQRTVEQNVCMSVPTVRQQRNVQVIPDAQVVERLQKQIVETIPQEHVQRTVEQIARVSVPTVQEQMNVQVIPGAQVVERIQKQIAETIPQERDQRTVEQNVCMSVPTVRQQRNVQEIPGTQVVERMQKQIVESVPHERDQRTDEQSACVSFPTVRQQRNVQENPGTQVVERIQKQIVETVPQERDQRTVEQNACVSVPTVQEQMIVQGIPRAQVVERIQKQIAEIIPQERDQRTVEQNVCVSVPLAAPRGATVAPVDVYTRPAPVIDFIPTPVIEYITPSAAVSYPSFLPSFDQIHEVVTDSEKPQFSITADETSKITGAECRLRFGASSSGSGANERARNSGYSGGEADTKTNC